MYIYKRYSKIDLQNVLECYLIILRNNEEMLNRKIEELKQKDLNLRHKEFILNKITKSKGKSEVNIDIKEHESDDPYSYNRNENQDLDNSQVEKTSKLRSAKVISKTKPLINNQNNLRSSVGKVSNDYGAKNQNDTSKNKAGTSTSKNQQGPLTMSPEVNRFKKSIAFNPVGGIDGNLIKKTMIDILKEEAQPEKKRLNRSVVVERKPEPLKLINTASSKNSQSGVTKSDHNSKDQSNSKSNQSGQVIVSETPRELKIALTGLKSVQADKRSVSKIDVSASQKKFETNAHNVSKGFVRKNDNTGSNLNNTKNVKFLQVDKKNDNLNKIETKTPRVQPDKKEIKEVDRKLESSGKKDDATSLNKSQGTFNKNLATKPNAVSINTSINNTIPEEDVKYVKKSVTFITSPNNNQSSENFDNLNKFSQTSETSNFNIKKDQPGKNLRYIEEEELAIISKKNSSDKPELKSNLFAEVKTKVVTKQENESKPTSEFAEQEGNLGNAENLDNNQNEDKKNKKRRKKSRKSREDNSLDISGELDKKRPRDSQRASANGEEKFQVRSSIFGSRNSSISEDQLDRSDILKNIEADPFDPSGGFCDLNLKDKIDLDNSKNFENSSNNSKIELFKNNKYNCKKHLFYKILI
jgi:hypothetical protein